MITPTNYNSEELQKFAEQSKAWWDPQGPLKTLHDINPARLTYVKKHINLMGKTVLDLGCGGGIFSESLAKEGAIVTGIDLAPELIATAKNHSEACGLVIDYQVISCEAFLTKGISFDIVTCMELLEHVPDPELIVRQCAQLVKPGGLAFFSSLNRNFKAYLYAIIGAEYLLSLLPKKTHDYAKFIKPSELAKWARMADLSLVDISGMSYNPITRNSDITIDTQINYLMCCQRDASEG